MTPQTLHDSNGGGHSPAPVVSAPDVSVVVAPDVSVVVVTYNCLDFCRACLDTLPSALEGKSWEVIVVDNASRDGTAEWLRANRTDVTTISMASNLGFSRANNAGFAVARGRHILVLNPDTLADPGSLTSLVDVLDNSPGTGMVAPRLVNTDGSDQRTARSFPTRATFFFGRRSPLTRMFPNNRWSRKYLRVGAALDAAQPYAVDWVSGACMLVPTAVVREVGGFDPHFFMYWEDADWCRRIHAAGLTVLVAPEARVMHHEGGSRNGWPARQVVAFHVSVFRYWRKHASPLARVILGIPVAGALAARAALTIIANRIGNREQDRTPTAETPASLATPARERKP